MKKNYIIAAVCVLLAGCRNMPDVPEVQETQAVQTESSAKETELAADVYENSGWEYGQVAIGGGGFVTGIISTCEPGLSTQGRMWAVHTAGIRIRTAGYH